MSELTTVGSAAASQSALANDLAFSLATTAHSGDKVAIATQDVFANVTDSRLYQTASGDLQVAPKPIGYVIGEQVVRPLIDGVAYIWSKMPSFSLPTAAAKGRGGVFVTGRNGRYGALSTFSGGAMGSTAGSSSGSKGSGGGGKSGSSSGSKGSGGGGKSGSSSGSKGSGGGKSGL